MRPSDADLVGLGPWMTGVNNLARETSVPRASLREGLNVDLSDDGKVRRRKGYTLVEAMANPDSVVGFGRRGFVLAGGELFAFEVIDGSIGAIAPIYTGLRTGVVLAHALIEPDIFLSDGDINLRIAPDNTVTSWTVPDVQTPSAVATATGSLPEGRYLVCAAARLMTGEEGPLSEPLELASMGDARFEITLPASSAPRVSLYMTKPNGTELMYVGAGVPGSSMAINSLRLGRPAPTLYLQSMPPAAFALYFRSRLLVGYENYVTASEPFNYGMTMLDFNTMSFSEEVTGLGTAGEAGGGFFVGQESKVYYVLGDDPNDFRLVEKYPAGMVKGTLVHVPGAQLPMDQPPTEPVPVWLATNGVVCVGMPDGSVLPLTETRYAADVGKTGAGLFLQRDGESRYVATTADPSDNVFAMRDDFSYEIVRNGIPKTI